jgi:hypothetical protein
VATTVIDALGDLYEGLTPALPTPLWAGQQPEGTARALPNACLEETGRSDFGVQANAGANGGTGVRFETTRWRFSLWYAGMADAAAGAAQLAAALTPKVVTVTGAKTACEVERTATVAAAERGPDGEFLYRAEVDVRVAVAYT